MNKDLRITINHNKSEAFIDASDAGAGLKFKANMIRLQFLIVLRSLEAFSNFVGIAALVTSSIIGSYCDIV